MSSETRKRGETGANRVIPVTKHPHLCVWPWSAVNHLVRACEPDARKIVTFALTSPTRLINFFDQNFFFQTFFLNFVKDSLVAVAYV